jgi:hypothetical protein
VNLIDPTGFAPQFNALNVARELGIPDNIFSIISPVMSGLPAIWQHEILKGLAAILQDTAPDEWEDAALRARGNIIDLRMDIAEAVQNSNGALTAHTIGRYLFAGQQFMPDGSGLVQEAERRNRNSRWLNVGVGTVGTVAGIAAMAFTGGLALPIVGIAAASVGAGFLATEAYDLVTRPMTPADVRVAFARLSGSGLPRSTAQMSAFLRR